MQVTTKTHVVTTKTHTAVFSADDLKAVALSSASKTLGVEVTSSKAEVGADGSITVEIVETITADQDDGAGAPKLTAKATVPPEPAPLAPAAAPSPGLHFPS